MPWECRLNSPALAVPPETMRAGKHKEVKKRPRRSSFRRGEGPPMGPGPPSAAPFCWGSERCRGGRRSPELFSGRLVTLRPLRGLCSPGKRDVFSGRWKRRRLFSSLLCWPSSPLLLDASCSYSSVNSVFHFFAGLEFSACSRARKNTRAICLLTWSGLPRVGLAVVLFTVRCSHPRSAAVGSRAPSGQGSLQGPNTTASLM